MVKLSVFAVLALAAGRNTPNPVAGVLEWAEPAFSLWSKQVREFLRFEADTITQSALQKMGLAGHASGPYEGLADADKDKVKEAFVPQCAAKLEDIAHKLDTLARARHQDPSPTLGVSMSTVIHVHCDYLPIPQEECDGLGTKLKHLVDAGHPLNPPELHEAKNETKEALLARRVRAEPEAEPAAEAPSADAADADDHAGKEEVLTDGGEWCGVFFDKFHDGLLKEAEESAGDEAEKEGLLLAAKFSKTSLTQQMKQLGPDAWAPMRSLLNTEIQTILALVKRKGVKEAYAKAADADQAKVKEAFGPLCAETLEKVQTNMLENAGNREMVADTMVGRELLGVSMSTHLQVQCSTTDFPLSEEECDLSATELYRLVEAGNPLIKPVAKNGTNGTNATAAPAEEAAEEAAEEPEAALKQVETATAPPGPAFQLALEQMQAGAHLTRNSTNGTEVVIHAHGEEWCGVFFDRFFAAILKAAESKEGGDEAAEELLQKLRPILRRAARRV